MHSWKRRNAEVESWYIFHAVSTSWVLILYFRIHYRLLWAYYVLKKNLEKSPTVLAPFSHSSHCSSPALGNHSILVHFWKAWCLAFHKLMSTCGICLCVWLVSLNIMLLQNDRVSFFWEMNSTPLCKYIHSFPEGYLALLHILPMEL